jgi:hypothetical protein
MIQGLQLLPKPVDGTLKLPYLKLDLEIGTL